MVRSIVCAEAFSVRWSNAQRHGSSLEKRVEMLAGSQRCKVVSDPGQALWEPCQQSRHVGSPVPPSLRPPAMSSWLVPALNHQRRPRGVTRNGLLDTYLILRSGLSHTDRGCRLLPGDTSSTVRSVSRDRLHTAAEVVMMVQLAIGWVLTGETGAWPIVSRGTNAGNYYVTVVHVGTGRCRTGSIRAWDLTRLK